MGIKLRFERPFVRDNTNRIVANESELVQQANLIASKVSQTDFNGNTISSLINQSATTIKIQAEKIQLEGIVTANSNFKVLLDGSIEAVNAKLSGAITATKMVSPSGNDYYGEIGISAGYVGFGLYDLRYNSSPYFRISELKESAGFNGFNIYDETGQVRVSVTRLTTILFGPTGQSKLILAPNSVSIVTPSGSQSW